MFSNLNLAQRGWLLVLIPVVLEILIVAGLAAMLSSAGRDLDRLEHQQQALLNLNKIGSSGGRAAILAMAGKSGSDDFKAALAELEQLENFYKSPQALEAAGRKDFPELKEAVIAAGLMRKGVLRIVHSKEGQQNQPKTKENRKARRDSRQALMVSLLEFSNLSEQIIELETSMKAQGPREMSRIRQGILALLFVIVVVGFVLALVMVRFFTSEILQRLSKITTNARRLATGAALLPVDLRHDEIAMLDQGIHEANNVLAEARRRELSVLDNATEVICSLDARLKFVAVNTASLSHWSYDADELLGMSLLTLLPQQSVEAVRLAFQRISEGSNQGLNEGSNDGSGERSKEGELESEVKTKDGSLRICRWSISWSEPEQRYSCVVHDVTELRAIEELKQQFLLIASHDLRSPLTAVAISISMALDGRHGSINDKQRLELEKAQRSMTRLTDLIGDLLELGTLESQTFVIESACVRAYNVCAIAAETLEAMATQAQVKLVKPHNDGLMFGDQGRLVQVMINLLSNAIKFSPPGAQVILAVDQLDQFIELSVSDSGPGIPSEDHALVFEKFRQSASVSDAGTKSSGLGLSIVKAIVGAHGGEVGVESTVGKGSRFWLRIPRYSGPEEEEGEL